MIFLKQSTGIDVRLGPFVDATDGVTPETGVTLSGADQAEILKANGAATVDISGATWAAVTGADGWYDLTLTTSHTDTVGEMVIVVQDSSVCLPVFAKFQVLEESIYDAMFGASAAGFDANGRVDVGSWLGTAVTTSSTSAKPEVDMYSISDDATAADNAELDYDGTGYNKSNSTIGTATALSTSAYDQIADDVWDEALSGHVAAGSAGASLYIIRSGTAQAGSTTSITLDASASASDDFYNNQRIYIVSGTGAGQGSYITDYTGSSKVANIQDTWVTAPSSDSVFVILPAGGIPGASAPSASTVAAAVWNEAMSGHVSEGSFGSMLQSAHEGTAQAGTSTSITLDATGSSSTNDFYNYQIIAIVSGTGAGQSRQITDYNGSTKVATVDPGWTTTPSTDSNYVIKDLGIDAATTGQIAASVWDEARSGHQTAGTFGEYVFADATRISGDSTAADNLESDYDGTGYTKTNSTIGTVTSVTNQVTANTTAISGDSTAADNLEAALDGTGGVTISANITGNIDGYAELRATGGTAGKNASELVADILTTQMTEAYASDGVAPTLAQALFAIQQRLYDADVSGTTLTVRQLDGTTAAITITLDDGSNPTDINRTG